MGSISAANKKKLEANPNVVRVGEKQVVFTPAFKKRAVELKGQGVLFEEIFLMNGIDPSFFPKKYCAYLIKKWVLKANTHGIESLTRESRGRRLGSRTEKTSKKSVAELEAIIAVQEELIAALKKKKALTKKS